jgi:hypothetical protein
MNIIFLDIDGVLNSQLYHESTVYKTPTTREESDLQDIDPKAIGFLNDLIKATEAKIVITSTWRRSHSDVKLQELFEKRGFIGKIIDHTPMLGEHTVRGNEILTWIERNEKLLGKSRSDFSNYVIFDDDSDMLYWQRNNFLLVDGYVGLTPNLCYKAEWIFKNFVH